MIAGHLQMSMLNSQSCSPAGVHSSLHKSFKVSGSIKLDTKIRYDSWWFMMWIHLLSLGLSFLLSDSIAQEECSTSANQVGLGFAGWPRCSQPSPVTKVPIVQWQFSMHVHLRIYIPDWYVTKFRTCTKILIGLGPPKVKEHSGSGQCKSMQIASVVCFRFLFQLTDRRTSTRLKSSLWLLGTQTIFGSCHQRFPSNSQTAMPSAPLLAIGHHHRAIGVNCIGQHQGNPECQSAWWHTPKRILAAVEDFPDWGWRQIIHTTKTDTLAFTGSFFPALDIHVSWA